MKALAILAQPDEVAGIFPYRPACRVFYLVLPPTSAIGRDVSITILAPFNRAAIRASGSGSGALAARLARS